MSKPTTYNNTRRVMANLSIGYEEFAELVEAMQDDLEIHEPQARNDIEACRNIYDTIHDELSDVTY